MLRLRKAALCAAAAFSCAAADAAPAARYSPKLQFRLEIEHTATLEAWGETWKMLRQVPGLCDEIWFGTGFGMPDMETHRKNAAVIRKAVQDVHSLGWSAGLQIQATIGHGGAFCEDKDYSGRKWGGWTNSAGVEDEYCNCPRDPRFLAYMREMSRVYAALHPSSVWIDDDLRIDNHGAVSARSLDGCWCDRCIADFNKETGGSWTRAGLAVAARKNSKLRGEYEMFAIRSVANVARVIAREFRAASPETVMGLQHCAEARRTVEAIVAALYEESGKPVGYRPGGAAIGRGSWLDEDPNLPIVKGLGAAECRRDFPHPEQIGLWTSEIACFPRTYTTKSVQTITMEALCALAYGMDAASALVLNHGRETEELYLRTRVKPMAEAAEVLRAYAKSCENTVPAGFAAPGDYRRLYAFAQTGVPVLPGSGKRLANITARELSFSNRHSGTAQIQALRDALDARAGGSPAVLESPFSGLAVPRVSKSGGTLRTVALLNLRLDAQGPVRLRLRNVPPGAARAVWREMRRDPVEIPLVRDGDAWRAEIPSISPWNGGYLDFPSAH